MIRKQRGDVTDEEYLVRMRAEDRSPWFRLAYFMEKYKALLWILSVFLLALGFGFKTPMQTTQRLEGKIDSNMTVNQKRFETVDHQIDLGSQERREQNSKLDVVLRYLCFDTRTSAETKRSVGLQCTQ